LLLYILYTLRQRVSNAVERRPPPLELCQILQLFLQRIAIPPRL